MRSIVASLFATSAILMACAQPLAGRTDARIAHSTSREESIQRLVEAVRDDPAKKPLLVRLLMSGDLLVIPDPGKKSLELLWFNQPERSFIPVFSSRAVFDQEAYGTGFEGKAISIDAKRFASLLEKDDLVILNPGHRPAIEFKADQLQAAVGP